MGNCISYGQLVDDVAVAIVSYDHLLWIDSMLFLFLGIALGWCLKANRD